MKQLKQKSLLFMLLLLIITGLGLTSCSGDDLGSNPSDDNSRFYVSVADAGYASASDGIHTKSAEQAYATKFTAGDKIGVFAVKNNQIIAEVNNLCLTASIESGNLVWKDASGNAPLKFDGAVYYAYYPYQSSLTGMLVPTATDADGFFANVISNWSPNTDQNSYDKYTAQDLMMAKGAISNSELSFAMQHEMVLVVIELPGTKYELSNTNPSLPNYITVPLDTKFDSYRPYRMSDDTYRYLVKPGSTNKLTGSYTNASNAAKGWEVNPAGISSGSYKTFKVDGGIANVISGYNLQVGDCMLKDGSLVSKDATLTPTQKANCIGVVYWIDPNGVNHGKVMSLDETTNTKWASANAIIGAGDDSNGLVNMKKVYALTNNFTNYPAFAWVHSLNNISEDYQNPNAVGVWYLPAKDELLMLYNAKSAVNGKLSTFSGSNSLSEYWYWSSTEVSSLANSILFADGGTWMDTKINSYCVRAVLTF